MNDEIKQAAIAIKENGGNDADLILLAEIDDLSTHIDESLAEVGIAFDKAVEEVKANTPDLAKIVSDIRGKDGTDGPQGPIGPQGETIVGPQGPQGPQGVPGRSMIALRGPKGADGFPGPAGKDGSPDTAEQVRDKLELLQGDDKLDKNAIRGITVSNLPPLNPKTGDLWIQS